MASIFPLVLFAASPSAPSQQPRSSSSSKVCSSGIGGGSGGSSGSGSGGGGGWFSTYERSKRKRVEERVVTVRDRYHDTDWYTAEGDGTWGAGQKVSRLSVHR